MSIGIHNLIENCYHEPMEETASAWFITKYLDWQKENQTLNSMAEFSRFLGVGDKAMNTWVNGRNNPSYKTAIKICSRLNDYTLLDLLGYPRPESESIPLASLPPELRERLRSALLEIEATLKERSIQPDSPAGAVISASVLQKFGFIINSMEKG